MLSLKIRLASEICVMILNCSKSHFPLDNFSKPDDNLNCIKSRLIPNVPDSHYFAVLNHVSMRLNSPALYFYVWVRNIRVMYMRACCKGQLPVVDTDFIIIDETLKCHLLHIYERASLISSCTT